MKSCNWQGFYVKVQYVTYLTSLTYCCCTSISECVLSYFQTVISTLLILVEQEEPEYKGETRVEDSTESDKEREMIQIEDSSNEISLGTAGTMVEETDASDSGAKKPPIGENRLRASSSPGYLPQGQQAVHQGRRGS